MKQNKKKKIVSGPSRCMWIFCTLKLLRLTLNKLLLLWDTLLQLSEEIYSKWFPFRHVCKLGMRKKKQFELKKKFFPASFHCPFSVTFFYTEFFFWGNWPLCEVIFFLSVSSFSWLIRYLWESTRRSLLSLLLVFISLFNKTGIFCFFKRGQWFS